MLSFWKVVIVAVLAFLVFRRLPLPRHPVVQAIRPFLSPFPRTTRAQPAQPEPQAPQKSWLHDRWFVFLLVMSATALAAWVLTRLTVMAPAGATH